MKRILEKEIMDDTRNAKAYASADFSKPNTIFVKTLLKTFDLTPNAKILDIGTGPADIPLMIHKLRPDLNITGIDASEAMLKIARKNIKKAKANKKIKLCRCILPDTKRLQKKYDVIISNSLIHHLPDPLILWKSIKKLCKKQGSVLIMDLIRPETKKTAEHIVFKHAKNESPLLKEDFYNSLLAAFTLKEIQEQLQKTKLSHLTVKKVTHRHWAVLGYLSE